MRGTTSNVPTTRGAVKIEPVWPEMLPVPQERTIGRSAVATADGRQFPYLTGGGGVGRVTERSGVVVDPIPLIPWDTN